MKKPIIGITANVMLENQGMKKDYVNKDYTDSIIDAGGIPFILPCTNDETIIKDQLQLVDGILFTGGVDLSPLAFGEEPIEQLGYVDEELDEFNMKAVISAYEMGIPMLGICRGMQIINVAFGGTLYQHLGVNKEFFIKHVQESMRATATHTINIKKNTILHKLLGNTLVVNSFHHQGIKEVAPEFIVTAVAPDGVIEGIEKKDDGKILAVQWHPESMYKKNKSMASLFKYFVETCKDI